MTESSALAFSNSEWTTRSVGTSATSRSLMSLMVLSSSSVACSMESIPASAATRMPPAPCACVVMRRPARCASSTAAAVSLGVYCETSGGVPPPRIPSVAEGLERRQRVALPHLGIEVRFAVEREVAVTVDETGQREPARPADGLAPFVRRGLRDFPALAGPGDLGTFDDDRRILEHALSVE